uniref:Tetraspanin-4 n=1 Tax=Bos taurus TaxID=9913 RepID=A0AAA9RRF4_BOVIN
ILGEGVGTSVLGRRAPSTAPWDAGAPTSSTRDICAFCGAKCAHRGRKPRAELCCVEGLPSSWAVRASGTCEWPHAPSRTQEPAGQPTKPDQLLGPPGCPQKHLLDSSFQRERPTPTEPWAGVASSAPHPRGTSRGRDTACHIAGSLLQGCVVEQLLDQVHVGKQHAAAAVALQAQVGLPLVADDLATREAANRDDHGGGAGARSFRSGGPTPGSPGASAPARPWRGGAGPARAPPAAARRRRPPPPAATAAPPPGRGSGVQSCGFGLADRSPAGWPALRTTGHRPPSSPLGGCGILGVGIWLAATQGNFATLSSSFPSLSAANLLIVTGAFVMAIGFVGCIGAIKENKCLLLTFFVALLLVFLLEACITILFFAYTDKIDRYAQRDLKKGLHLYGTPGNVGLTNAWSIIQTDFRCCGVSNYTDWFEVYNATRVPDSCCLEFSESCGLHAPGTWWKAPCYETVKMWLQENLLAVGVFGLCTALVQILGLTFAMTMYCQVVRADAYCA